MTARPDGRGAVLDALRAGGVIGAAEAARLVPLAGGVSSDIWRLETGGRALCVKRALPRLKVAAEWRVPVERNRYEAEWIRRAGRAAPASVPTLIHEDRAAGLIVMDYLDPAVYPVWKDLLRDGLVSSDFAAAVGGTLARLHAASAGDARAARAFRTDGLFHALRLEPYLLTAAAAHPVVARPLRALARRTASGRAALVHGDVSPKNILAGPDGPVFLDAECAWYGDPAFDLAFCLNHLLLKCLWRPAYRGAYLEAFAALGGAYLGAVTWEAPDALETRAARLVPGLLLARVDGKSPVEYLTDAADLATVRAFAFETLRHPPEGLRSLSAGWREAAAR